jgi:hypothetical protein
MTSIVGISCKDGVVIGTDSAATFGHAGGINTIEQPVKKIEIIHDTMIVAGTGALGLGQRFCHVARTKWGEKTFRDSGQHPITQGISRGALDNFQETYVSPLQHGPLSVNYGALVAFPFGRNSHMCEFEAMSLQPELKGDQPHHCSMGSGQLITDSFLGFLRSVFWDGDRPTLAEGIFYTVWTLQQAIDLNPGGVNGPINIAILEDTKANGWRARLLSEEEFSQHLLHMEDVKKHLAQFKDRLTLTDVVGLAMPPKP